MTLYQDLEWTFLQNILRKIPQIYQMIIVPPPPKKKTRTLPEGEETMITGESFNKGRIN
jgi:hypothetical protein